MTDKTQKPRSLAHAPETLGNGTKVTTNTEVVRQPFSGTVVETHDQLQATVQDEAEFEEQEIREGTVIRTYTGVQPGAKIVMVAAAEAEAPENAE